MDEDSRDLIQQLFALLTGRLEEAHEIAVEGQDAKHRQESIAGRARYLEARAREIATVSAAISAIADPAVDQARAQDK